MHVDSPIIVPSLVQSVPLFANLEEESLRELLGVFERQTFEPGEVLFQGGDRAQYLRVLISGMLSARDDGGEVMRLHPPAPVGELSALSGGSTRLTVAAVATATVLAAPLEKLNPFLAEHGQISTTLHQNLLALASRKIARDRRRIREMRGNIVRTQRAMKQMRDSLGASEDTPLHAELFDALSQLIEQNRQAHYLVEPSRLVATSLRFDSGGVCSVTALSEEWAYVEQPPVELRAGTELTATLVLGDEEIAVSGRVERRSAAEARIALDPLIDDYRKAVQVHLARAQLLDIVL